MGYGFDDDTSNSTVSSRGGSSRDTRKSDVRRSISRRMSRPLPSRSDHSRKPSSVNHKSKFEALQKQTELYAELSRELEEKLSKRNAEILALRRSNKVLQQECSGHRSRISDLETQCVARSEKVVQLSDTIAARKSNKVQERLVEKSLKVAELVEQIQRLKIQKKNLQDHQSKSSKLLQEMSQTIRMLNKIDVPYEKANDDENGCYSDLVYNKNMSEESPQDIPMENNKRKIVAIELALKERDHLRNENVLQQQKLEAMRANNAELTLQIASLQAKLREREEEAKRHQGKGSESGFSRLEAKLNGNKEQPVQGSEAGNSGETSGTRESEYTYETASPDYHCQTASFSDESSKEVSYEEFLVENDRSLSDDQSQDSGMDDSFHDGRDILFSQVNRSLSTVDECSDASFSSVEAPPSRTDDEFEDDHKNADSSLNRSFSGGVRPEEHKQLQLNFEKALDVIEKLKYDLSQQNKWDSPGNPYKRDFEKASKEVAKLEQELNAIVSQHGVLKAEHQALCDNHEEELETSKRIRADLEATHKKVLSSLEQASKANLVDLKNQNKHLERQYNDLETEYSLKIESLELKLKEMKHQSKQWKDDSSTRVESLEDELKKSRKEMKKLQGEYDAIDSVHQERINDLSQEHAKYLEKEKKRFEDLRYEYDTFLEIHLKLEEEAQQAKDHYKESLLKIRNLEAEGKATDEASEKIKMEHTEVIQKMEISHQEAAKEAKAEHEKALRTMETTMLEWKGKFVKLKRDHIAAIKGHNESTQKFMEEIKQIQNSHRIDMAKQGRMRQNDAAKYQKLRKDFDAALVDHGKKEQITIHECEKSKQKYESKMEAYQQQIKEFEELIPLSKKQKLKEKIDSIRLESNERADQLQAELLETTERLKAEANQRFLSAKADSKKEVDRLVETNENLKKHAMRQEIDLQKSRECQEKAKTTYQELAKSYQAALLKIESLIQQQEEASAQKSMANNIPVNRDESKATKGGSVMERTKHLEKNKNEKLSQLKPVPENMPTKPEMRSEEFSIKSNYSMDKLPYEIELDPGFQKDFDMIVTKLGGDSSCLESNFEVSSVVSFAESSIAGNSIAGSAIFEAIYKRVEEHAQKMEVWENDRVVAPQISTSNSFEVENIFDILHHFMKLREVNSCVRNRHSKETITSLNEPRETNEQLSYLLLHRKNFESVQNSLLRHLRPLDSISPSIIDFSVQNTIEEGLSYADELSVELNSENEVLSKTCPVVARQQEEKNDEKLYTKTDEIRSKKRETEIRLLEQKYQKLSREFQQMKSDEILPPPTDINLPLHDENEDYRAYNPILATSTVSSMTSPAMHGAMQGASQIDRFQRKVLAAELKVEYTKRDWQQQKSQVHEARKEQDEIDQNYKTMMSQLKDIESYDGSFDRIIFDDNDSSPCDELKENHNESGRKEEGLVTRHIKNCDADAASDDEGFSFGVPEDYTSFGESQPVSLASLEPHQTKKPLSFNSSTSHTEGETVYISTEDEKSTEDETEDDTENDDDESSNNRKGPHGEERDTEAVELELRQAKEAAEAARRKQKEREENLRDVIFQYKELERKHNDALAAKDQLISSGKSKEKIEKELEQALTSVSTMKDELESACERHSEESGHLRDVMGQFQALQLDFLNVLAQKQELEKAVYQRPAMTPGVVPDVNNAAGPQPRFVHSSGSWIGPVPPPVLNQMRPQPRFLNSSGSWIGPASHPTSDSSESQSRFLDSVGSWFGGSSIGGTSIESTRPKSKHSLPRASPLNRVKEVLPHPDSCRIVELCAEDRVPLVKRSRNNMKPQTIHRTSEQKSNSISNSNLSVQSSTSKHVRTASGAQPKEQQQQQQQPRQSQPTQPQPKVIQHPPQQQQVNKERQQEQKHPSTFHQSPTPKPASKKKLGLFRGWKKQKSPVGQ